MSQQQPQPGPLLKAAQKIVLLVVYVLFLLLLFAGLRDIGETYRYWLAWVILVALVFFIVRLSPVVLDVVRTIKEKGLTGDLPGQHDHH